MGEDQKIVDELAAERANKAATLEFDKVKQVVEAMESPERVDALVQELRVKSFDLITAQQRIEEQHGHISWLKGLIESTIRRIMFEPDLVIPVRSYESVLKSIVERFEQFRDDNANHDQHVRFLNERLRDQKIEIGSLRSDSLRAKASSTTKAAKRKGRK